MQRKAVLLAALLLCAHAALAETYRWVDSAGNVHYSDTPPLGDTRNIEEKHLGTNVIQSSDVPYATRLAAKNFPVVLYVTDDCGDPCSQAKNYLAKRGVPYSSKSVADQATRDALQKISGQASVPTLVVGKQAVAGFEASSWDAALDAAGYPKAPAQ
jgi:glutaredoxin